MIASSRSKRTEDGRPGDGERFGVHTPDSAADPLGDGLAAVCNEMDEIRRQMSEQEDLHGGHVNQTDRAWRESASNLLHYLTLRHRDIRPLQRKLAALGLSSLGRSEAHVMATVDAVRSALQRLGTIEQLPEPDNTTRFEHGYQLLVEHTRALFGPEPRGRSTRIMVTLPSAAADDSALVKSLVAGGMDCARINCAHDGAAAWERMIRHVRAASRELGRECRIQMDLGGPKIRTGEIDPRSQVVKWRPRRDESGAVVSPVRVWLTSEDRPPWDRLGASLRVSNALAGALREGDRIRFRDLRGKRRCLRVDSREGAGWWLVGEQTIYLRACSEVSLEWSSSSDGPAPSQHRAYVFEAPSASAYLVLQVGDRLIVRSDDSLGRPAILDRAGRVVEPAQISCTLPQAIRSARVGDPIWFDDGKIGGVVESVDPTGLRVHITSAGSQGSKLRADKGINLPESPPDLSALTARDLADLDFVVKHAEIVALSFVSRPNDLTELQDELRKRSGEHLGIVLKIETRSGFEHFAELLLSAMRSASVGVMIARGDLAIECGYERLAEIQEEILWICEAAHVPVIWATQVLENLAKTGQPSRAEVTDAAMGERAECVMLNKGPFLVDAVRALNDILCRMRAHQHKKSAMMRQLRVANLPAASPRAN